jgi:hypothetical protein
MKAAVKVVPDIMGQIEERTNDVRSLAAVLLAVSVALSYEKTDTTDVMEQPVTLGTAEGWLDQGVAIVWQKLDDMTCEIQDLACKAKGRKS